MRRIFRLLLLFSLLPQPAVADGAYKCTTAHGAVAYQDHPCARGERQDTLSISMSAVPSSPAPASSAAVQVNTAPAPQPTAPSTPGEPLPLMYVCVKATDGKSYLSTNGNPQPYAVPWGILGAVSQPLAQVYGSGGGGASAPELNRGKVNSNLVAGHFTWVQDSCRALSIGETCKALRDDYDEVEHKLRHAFKDERGSLEQRESHLRAQLANC
ncbi:DUF4124 domain-containing protein [Dyella sp.]|uniref:DUF4124 domain-containing protein n=1 Tax=Dyella sp. TaxID=1869338 RepID=UPI002ED075BC